MIQSFFINNFKSYKSAQFKLAPLTVLIGANASGKSNAIEALRLMSWISNGNKLSSIKFAVEQSGGPVRGRVSDLARGDLRGFSLGFFGGLTDGLHSTTDYNRFIVSLREEEDELYIVDERVTSVKSIVPLYEVFEPSDTVGHDLKVAYNNFARGGVKPKVRCVDQQPVFIQLESSARFDSGHKKSSQIIPSVCSRIQKWLNGMAFLDPSPGAMRGYGHETDDTLSQDGSNLSGVLYNLCKNPDVKSEVLSLIRALPEQEISDIFFIKTARGEVMLSLVETFGGEKRNFDASLLSDGTLRVLSIATALLSAPEGSVVVVEEIDNGVHPSRAQKLLHAIVDLAERRSLKVVLSTHNPALLDSVPDRSIGEVVFCYRDNENGSSKLTALKDFAKFPSLISRGSLGYLMTEGIIDRFAKAEEDSGRDALKWLQRVRSQS
jgi:predicted ATPase